MHKPAVKMTPRDMSFATAMAQSRVKEALRLAQKYQEDPHREHRLAEHKCKACYYRTVIAGAAITMQPCMCCGKEQMYSSTNTDVLCVPCAKTHALCKHCGGDVEMNSDRKDWPSAD